MLSKSKPTQSLNVENFRKNEKIIFQSKGVSGIFLKEGLSKSSIASILWDILHIV
jgi:hypothetical protein